jgi:hypothetical protein
MYKSSAPDSKFKYHYSPCVVCGSPTAGHCTVGCLSTSDLSAPAISRSFLASPALFVQDVGNMAVRNSCDIAYRNASPAGTLRTAAARSLVG